MASVKYDSPALLSGRLISFLYFAGMLAWESCAAWLCVSEGPQTMQLAPTDLTTKVII